MMNRILRRSILLLLALLTCFGLAACSGKTRKDAYGFERPESCWLTDCLVLDEEPDYDEVFGTGGESGLVDEELQKLDCQLDGYGYYYLVCLVYGTPAEGSKISTGLRFCQVGEGEVSYDSNCVRVGTPSAYGDLEVTLDINLPVEERLKVTYTADKKGAVQGMIVIPFTLYDTDDVLNIEVSLDVDGVESNYVVDEWEQICPGIAQTDKTKAIVSEMSVRYLTATAYNGGNYTDEVLSATPSFEDGDSCYLVLDFSFQALENNDGMHSIDVMAYVPERHKMSATIEEAPTGKIQENTYNGESTLYATYTLPAMMGETKSVRMLFRLHAINGGEVELSLFVFGDSQTVVVGHNYTTQMLTAAVGSLTYTLNADGRSYTAETLVNQALLSVTIPDELGDGLPVTEIGSSLFANNEKIEHVTLGKNIQTVNTGDFLGCSALKSIALGGVQRVEAQSFKNCLGLTSLTIPSSVLEIGESAFEGCSALASLTFEPGVQWIRGRAFNDCKALTSLTIPETVTSIGYGAFAGCGALESISVPFVGAAVSGTNNTHFGYIFGAGSQSYHAEYVPASLKSVVITGGDTIASGAFDSCVGLVSITMPEEVTSIGSNAFRGCSSLRAILIPAAVTDIWSSAFYGCTSLESLRVAEGNTEFHSAGDCLIDTASKTLFLGCKSSVIPADGSVTSIAAYAFKDCSGLTSIIVPPSVTSIGSHAFEGCTGLESITLPFVGSAASGSSNVHFGYIFGAFSAYDNSSYVPASLKNVVITGGNAIGSNAFQKCDGLVSVLIPSSVTSIASGAFSGCLSLKHLTLPFVGGGIKTATDTYQYPLGYIFGSSNSYGGVATTQYYYGSNTSTTTYTKYYFPTALSSVTVTGGEILYGAFYNCKTLTTVTIPDGTTTIADAAFYHCSSLISTHIPAGVISIGQNTFKGCSNLSEITVAAGNPVYHSAENCLIKTATRHLVLGCKSSVIPIDGSVTSIGNYAFYQRTGLETISLPACVTAIGEFAFSSCQDLCAINVAAGNPVYRSVGNCLIDIASKTLLVGCKNSVIPADGSVTTIGEYAFDGCLGLVSIVVPSVITTIQRCAFQGCSALESITLPFVGMSQNGTENTHFGYIFGASSYSYHPNYVPASLKHVVVTGGSTVASFAFGYCNMLVSVVLPSSVISIGSGAFVDCDALERITLPFIGETPDGTSHTNMGYIFGANSYSYHSNYVPASLKHVVVTGGSSVPKNAFRGCTALVSVTLPAAMTAVGDSAFYGCSALTAVALPAALVSIGTSAFYGCGAMESIVIPAKVLSIGASAFSGCTELFSISFESTAGWTADSTALSATNLKEATIAATYLKSTYCTATWTRSES